jgi:hypothetical protein
MYISEIRISDMYISRIRISDMYISEIRISDMYISLIRPTYYCKAYGIFSQLDGFTLVVMHINGVS